MSLDKKSIIQQLETIALLLELSGASPFKSQAFANAARILQQFQGDLDQAMRDGSLRKMRGIGQSTYAEIQSLYESGESPARQELSATVPEGLLQMSRVPGLGPKRIVRLHLELGIASLGELEYACNENRLAQLSGFGAKSQAKILSGIHQLHRYAGRYLISDALHVAEDYRQRLLQLEGVEAVEIAGSIRRRMETVKDIDILVSSTDPASVTEAFFSFPEVEEILSGGEALSRVRTREGFQVDLRQVEAGSFAFALVHFTGSKEHNTVLRARARGRGWKLNEYGFTAEDGGPSAPRCSSEEEVYRALDLSYIAPEMRENLGEIEAAEAGVLPVLVEPGDLRGCLHNHSTWSDGAHSIAEMAEAARAMGWQYLGISDHSRSAAYAGGLSAEDLLRQGEEIDRLNASYKDFRILKGVESDILAEGELDYEEPILQSLDFVVASVHSRLGLSREEQTRRCLRAVENPHTTILGHPSGRLLLARDEMDLDMDAILEAMAGKGCAVELNSNPHRLDLDWRHLRQATALGIPVSISPDAHRKESLRDIFHGVDIARKGWCTSAQILNCRPLESLGLRR